MWPFIYPDIYYQQLMLFSIARYIESPAAVATTNSGHLFVHMILHGDIYTFLFKEPENSSPHMARPRPHISWTSVRYFPKSFSASLTTRKTVSITFLALSNARQSTQHITQLCSPDPASLQSTMRQLRAMKRHRSEQERKQSTSPGSAI